MIQRDGFMFPEREGDTVEIEGKLYRFVATSPGNCSGCAFDEGEEYCRIKTPCFSYDYKREYILKEVDNNGSN